MNYNIVSLADRPDLEERFYQFYRKHWPEFMLEDVVASTHWMPLMKAFLDCQLLLMSGSEILAVLDAVPLNFEKSLGELPDEGFDWALKKSLSDYQANIKSNVLVGLQIVVSRNHQGKGLSLLAVKEMTNLAKQKGITQLVIPVRPSDKHKYALIPMENYIKWKNKAGFPLDNWLRVHIKAGGEIIKVCSRSMYIPGTIEEWKQWTKLDFPESGSYIIPGALNPISIDIEKDEAIYIEPNVWILHRIK